MFSSYWLLSHEQETMCYNNKYLSTVVKLYNRKFNELFVNHFLLQKLVIIFVEIINPLSFCGKHANMAYTLFRNIKV